MGLFDLFKKRKKCTELSPVVISKNSIAKPAAVFITSKANDIWDKIPQDIKRLLFTSDADKPNAPSLGITITIDFSGKVNVGKNKPDDPSTIYFKAPIAEPNDFSSVPKPPYYPSYAGLSPEQRFIYLNWLSDISKEVDVGYKFLFYYGLERHLLIGDFENALDMIIRLRKNTSNNSFRWYSLRALFYTLLIKNRQDLVYKLKFLYDDEYWQEEQLWIKVITDDNITAEELIKILKYHDINKRYINNEPKLYSDIMESLLFEKFGHPYIESNKLIEKKPSGVYSGFLYANYSFPQDIQKRNDIPKLNTGNFFSCIIDLHNKCHELTKEKLAEKRKSTGYAHTKTKTSKKEVPIETKYINKQEANKERSLNLNSKTSKKYWIEKLDDKTAEGYSNIFVEKMNLIQENDGEFWFNEIKKYRELPDQRLALALKNLPLPAAFRECFVALRDIINEKKKNNENFENEYKFLYKLGAVQSMSIPYSEKKEQPGYNVMVKIPGGMLFKLPTPYDVFGYEKIGFSKTDCKAFVSLWGEPKSHTTMNEYYHEIWEKYENKLRRL